MRARPEDRLPFAVGEFVADAARRCRGARSRANAAEQLLEVVGSKVTSASTLTTTSGRSAEFADTVGEDADDRAASSRARTWLDLEQADPACRRPRARRAPRGVRRRARRRRRSRRGEERLRAEAVGEHRQRSTPRRGRRDDGVREPITGSTAATTGASLRRDGSADRAGRTSRAIPRASGSPSRVAVALSRRAAAPRSALDRGLVEELGVARARAEQVRRDRRPSSAAAARRRWRLRKNPSLRLSMIRSGTIPRAACFSRYFVCRPRPDLEVGRDRRAVLDDVVVEERDAHLERVRHRRPVEVVEHVVDERELARRCRALPASGSSAIPSASGVDRPAVAARPSVSASGPRKSARAGRRRRGRSSRAARSTGSPARERPRRDARTAPARATRVRSPARAQRAGQPVPLRGPRARGRCFGSRRAARRRPGRRAPPSRVVAASSEIAQKPSDERSAIGSSRCQTRSSSEIACRRVARSRARGARCRDSEATKRASASSLPRRPRRSRSRTS